MSSPDSNPKLPPWLRDQPLPPRPLAAGEPATPAPTPATAGDLPPWLQDAPAAASTTGAEPAAGSALPSWLADLQADVTPEAPAEALPDWLQAEAQPGIPAPDDDIPDWLRSEAPITTPAEAVPDWLRADAPARPVAADDDIPDWLRDSTPGPTTQMPQWMADEPAVPAPAATDQAASPADAVPDWLQESDPPASAAAPVEAVPDWLRGDAPAAPPPGADDDALSIAPFSFEDLGGPPASGATAGPPSWLGDATSDEDGPAWLNALPASEGAPTSQPADAPPAWLREPDVPAAPIDQAPDWPGAADPAPAVPAPAPPAPTSPPPARPDDDVPAWLRADDTSAGPPAWLAAPAEPEADTVPAWLGGSTPAAPAAGDVPAWLSATGDSAVPEPPSEAPPQAEPPPADDVPAWLRETPASSSAPTAGIASGAVLPDWLRDDSAQPVASERSTPDLPAWLRPAEAAPPAPPAPPAEPPVAPPAPLADDVPPWLRDEAGAPLPTAAGPGDAGLPSWLHGATLEEPPAPPEASPATAAATPDLPPRPRAPAPDEGESSFFGGTDLPAWLRVPEPEPAAELSPADARSLDWLTRLGPTEDEGAAVIAAPAAVAKLPPRPEPRRTAAHNESLALLARLAADPFPASVTPAAPAPATVWRRLGLERVLYVLLLVGLLVAIALPSLTTPLQVPPVVPGAERLLGAVGNLTNRDVVLVAYEWDARRVGELRPLENAVIGQMIAQQVKLLTISTDPQGALLSFEVLDRFKAAKYQPAGVDYLLLGYKPGGELALRQMAQDFRTTLASDFYGDDANVSLLASGKDTGRPLTNLANLSMIVVMADDPSDVQGWMEQVHRSAPQVPIIFLLPAEADPLTQPYTRQDANVYSLAGRQGALAYRGLRGPADDAAQVARESGAQRAGLLLFSVLLLIGMLVTSMAAATRRRPR